MSAPTRVKRSFPRSAAPELLEHHWMLASPDGVLTFCTVDDAAAKWGDVQVDGVWWTPWGITAHIPARRCNGSCEAHEVDGCGLLDGVTCCVASDTISDCRELLGLWIASDRDDELIWAELDRRFDGAVTASVVGGVR